MTIKEIKANLSILTVLQHYNLNPNRNGMLCCPFHQDKKASMKIYRDTDTVYCFAGSCEVNNLDVIDFIMKMEKSSKHEALLKAKSLISGAITKSQTKLTFPNTNSKMKKENPSLQFNRYLKSFTAHREAQAYCERRGLNPLLVEIGYKS